MKEDSAQSWIHSNHSHKYQLLLVSLVRYSCWEASPLIQCLMRAHVVCNEKDLGSSLSCANFSLCDFG